jgi:hypothetical protein
MLVAEVVVAFGKASSLNVKSPSEFHIIKNLIYRNAMEAQYTCLLCWGYLTCLRVGKRTLYKEGILQRQWKYGI